MMRKNIFLAILLVFSCSIYAQDKVKPSQMSTATKNSFKAVLGIDAINDTISDHRTDINAKAPKNSPEFTGNVTGISKSMVGLGNVDNTSDENKPVSAAANDSIQTLKASFSDSINTIRAEQAADGVLFNEYFYSKAQVDSVMKKLPHVVWPLDGVSSGLPKNTTGDLTEHTILTIPISAKEIGTNGRFKLEGVFTCNSSTEYKNLRFYINSVATGNKIAVINNNGQTGASANFSIQFWNRNGSQVGISNALSTGNAYGIPGSMTSSGVYTYSFDFTVATSLIVTAQVSTSTTNNIQLETLQVIVIP